LGGGVALFCLGTSAPLEQVIGTERGQHGHAETEDDGTK
jgi:hypothetical protein